MHPTAPTASGFAEIGKQLMARHQIADAIRQFESALQLEPGNPNLHVLLAWALPKAMRFVESEQHLEVAISLNPELAVAYGMLGFRRQERGDFQGAIQCFERGIALQPSQAGSYFGIVTSRKVTAADLPLVSSMEALAKVPSIPAADKLFLHYGMGKAFDDLGEYGSAIAQFDLANQLSVMDRSLGSKHYDRKGHQKHVDATIERYTKGFLEGYDGYRSESDAPILIVGMPRSGTTLVEQVLSCHPKVAARGELFFWRDETTAWRRQLATGHPETSTGKAVAKAYLNKLNIVEDGANRATDKMPINYLFLGAFHLLFPNAKIIHCTRNPVDTCLSIYMTRIVPPEYSNQRDNIVFCYRQYERLLAHWHAVLPQDRLMKLSYEDLVENQETTTRRMLEFCGLPWDNSCLRPQDNIRQVTTPSLWQARQPVYRSSLERWRRYEPWLGEFSELIVRE